MGAIDGLTHELVHRKNGFSPEERAALDAPEVWPEVNALQSTKTSERLRELLTQLSVLVVRNVGGEENHKPLPIDTIARVRS
jgi:hypothetical protein